MLTPTKSKKSPSQESIKNNKEKDIEKSVEEKMEKNIKKNTSNISTSENLQNEISLKENEIEKDSKWFFENVMEKLSKKRSNTISISIFLILRENNYEPMSMQQILNKIYEKLNKDHHSIIKNKPINNNFMNDLQIKNGFYAAIRENMGLRTVNKNNTTFINVDFEGATDYFRNLKIRHVYQGILDDSDINYLFPELKDLSGKKRNRDCLRTPIKKRKKNEYFKLGPTYFNPYTNDPEKYAYIKVHFPKD